MKVKFQADADLNENIVKSLRRRIPEVDFKTATDAGLEGVHDEDVLTLAADEARVLVTHDRKTMPMHFGRFLESRTSPGVIVVSKNAEIARLIDDLILIWEASDADEFYNTIRSIPF